MKRSKGMLFAAAAAVPCAAAWGQGLPDGGGGIDAPQLDTVTVTARRSIEQRFYAAGSLVVVDRKDIEQLGAFSVSDVLRQLPGVQVTTQGDGGVEIRMRGMERGATQLLIDGQRTRSGRRAQLPLDNLPAELIERIEVVRAPTAEFSGATGGTINIVLRQATAKRETVLRLTDNRVWGHNAGQAFASRTGPLGGQPAPAEGELPGTAQPWSYFAAVASTGLLLGSDTHRTTDSSSSGATTSDAAGRSRRSELSLVPRLNGHLGRSDQIQLRGTFSRAHVAGGTLERSSGTGIGGAPWFLETRDAQDYTRRYLQGAAEWTHRFAGSKLETTASASEAREGVEREAGPLAGSGAAPAYAPYTFHDTRREALYSLATKLSGTSSPLLWTVGAQADRRRLDVDTLREGASPLDLRLRAVLDRFVLWGQNEWEVLNGATLSAGLRGETLLVKTDEASGSRERRFNVLQPSLHLRKPLSDSLQYRANVARITREPRVWDLVDRAFPSQGRNSLVNPDFAGNPDLRPEIAWTLDTGFERRLGTDGQMGANLFVRRTRDTIAPLTQLVGERWTEQRVNIGDATVWGLEVDAKSGLAWLGLARDWTLSANASLLQSRMTSGINRGSRIPGQARYTANLTIAKPVPRGGGLFGGGTLSLTGPAELHSSPQVTGRDRARTTLDVYLGGLVRGWGYWRVGVYNIGDAPFRRERRYVDSAGGTLGIESRMTLTPRVYLAIGTQF
ncbi:TonB-dependent receptor [Ramlibacter sp.]|uniref:TonB-dependent receptor plug domain-containing protein n=1 Tax=Ramlibacter sp. TaxID=1917967 RepID=UPI0017E4A746|nr:TonB-dependent receptor [Ramlibacter sp.]MBA2676576.1 TonB-dependent receptor [Ramlibacter sp.]